MTQAFAPWLAQWPNVQTRYLHRGALEVRSITCLTWVSSLLQVQSSLQAAAVGVVNPFNYPAC